MAKRLPPKVGALLTKPVLYHPYQQELLRARRMRLCKDCNKIGFTGTDGIFRCPVCKREDTNAPRVYRYFGAFAGRRGGKSVVGAYAAREEMLVPNTLGWVCGPTYKILHDATMPTLLGLIPREWCANWDQDNLELTLVNGSQVQFRSLDDPDRGHAGVGLHWTWFDEAAFISELAWDYLRPALSDYRGAAFFTSSVDGYDWTYDRLEKPALVDKKPGFWAAKWKQADNPAIPKDETEEARLTMPPHLFRQEYEASRENFTGSIYGEWMDGAWLADDAAIKAFIPEWPNIQNRRVIMPLDSGVDHPFGAVALVVTEKGIVVVREYLERQRAFSTHLSAIRNEFRLVLTGNEVMWGANRNEAALRMEFAAHGIGIAPAENDQKAGIQRVLSWLYTGQLKFAYTCPKTFEQMKEYRYADNTAADGQKTAKEKVFKKKDELPDCVRYGLMLWPSLPKTEKLSMSDMEQARWDALDERSRMDIERMRAYEKREKQKDMEEHEGMYPGGEFFGGSGGGYAADW